MKAMEGDSSGNGFDGDAGGRHTRALAKRCIMLTEENKVRYNGRSTVYVEFRPSACIYSTSVGSVWRGLLV